MRRRLSPLWIDAKAFINLRFPLSAGEIMKTSALCSLAALAPLALAGCASRAVLAGDAETDFAPPGAFSRADLPGAPAGDGAYSRDRFGDGFALSATAPIAGARSFAFANATEVRGVELIEDPTTGRIVSRRSFTVEAGGQERKTTELRSAAYVAGAPTSFKWTMRIDGRRDAGLPVATSPMLSISHAEGPSILVLLAPAGCAPEPGACASAAQIVELKARYVGDRCLAVDVARGSTFGAGPLSVLSMSADAPIAMLVSILADRVSIEATGAGVSALPAGADDAAVSAACADASVRLAAIPDELIPGRDNDLRTRVYGPAASGYAALYVSGGLSLIENFACFEGPGAPCPQDVSAYALPNPLSTRFDNFRIEALVRR